MTAEEILNGLQTQIIGRQLEIHHQVRSTNDLALQRGIEGAPEGTVILAESQTAGRGRHGRTWHAPPGSSLLASVLLRHRLLASQIGLLNLVGAVAIAVAISEVTNLPAQLKWPNDVTIREKKVSGILTELEYDRHQQPFSVMGFGVNVNMSLGDFPENLRDSATSLQIESQRVISRAALMQTLLHRLEENYLYLKHGQSTPIIEAANRLSATIGQWVQIQTPDGAFKGLAEQIDRDGGLLIRDAAGKQRKFLIGEVVHAGGMFQISQKMT